VLASAISTSALTETEGAKRTEKGIRSNVIIVHLHKESLAFRALLLLLAEYFWSGDLIDKGFDAISTKFKS
jgi:hypothetical protein